ncbi:ABC transporter ATP-binding protein [Streptomyces sp. JW3]|uniref:ABC transporter ATP-binding protein n=1 Tax=Streptomyces sp. JW3 TaxID=3456955 RepID=UPI003FA43274
MTGQVPGRPAGTGPLAEIDGLTLGPVTGGPPVLRDVRLSLPRGQVLGVVGRSGSGKSSLAYSLLGHVRPGLEVRGGTVRVAGLDPFDRAGARRLRGRVVSYLGQDPASALNPALRIGTQIAEAVRLRSSGRRTGDDVRTRVEELLRSVRLPADRAFRRRLPGQLSGGQAQRVALALTLAGAPSLLVLDEPTSNLDTVLAAGTRRLLGEILAAGDRSALLVSHDPAWLASVADDVIRLDAGRIAPAGAPKTPVPMPVPAPIPVAPAPDDLARNPASIASAPATATPATATSATATSTSATATSASATSASATATPATATSATATSASATAAPAPAAAANAPTGELSVRGLYAAHGRVPVLHDVSLTVPAGCRTAVVGPSGSGKTTLARCLAGLHRPARGGVEWTARGGAERGGGAPVQLVAQDARGALNPRESVRTALMRPLTGVGRRPDRDAAGEAVRLLGQVGLAPDVLTRRPGELSGGQRQRVALARTLAARPRVLVCDEITSALDPETADGILDLLDSLRRTLGLTVVMVTHDLAAAARHADRVVVLAAGRVAEAGPADRVLAAPEHPVTRELLACADRPVATVAERRCTR